MDRIDIGRFGEQDIREEVIAPILRELGYRTGTPNDIRREVTLRYPHDFLGRKKPASDPPIRGRADYLLDVDQRIRWTIEAKPAEPPLSEHDVEQAFTYARHPEIRAAYFCLCNGRELRVYATDASASAAPLTTITGIFDSIEAAKRLSALLGPDALKARFAIIAADTLPALGPGLSSFAQIIAGAVRFESVNVDLPFLRGFVITVTGGAIQRDPEVGLVFYLTSLAPNAAMQRLNERLGLARFEALANGDALSVDEAHPTTFSARFRVVLPRGERVLNMNTWQENELPFDIACNATVRGSGILVASHLTGRFDAEYSYTWSATPGDDQALQVNASGSFLLVLK
jgi:hypothetical protein